MNEKQEFNLNDIMSNINLKDYVGINPELDEKIVEHDKKRKDELKQKLKNKLNNMKNSRMNKNYKEETQLNSLKNNPAFQNMDNQENVKKAIDMMASSYSNDSKQKKNIKKQIEKLVDKIKQPEI